MQHPIKKLLDHGLITKVIVILTAFMITGHMASAALLIPEGNLGSLEEVQMPQSVQVSIENESFKLTSVGYGLRTKKVVFVTVKVYLGQLFVSDLASFKKAEALASVKTQKSLAMQLHFLRNVDGETVQKSFQEALTANDISLNESDVKQFLEVVKNAGEVKEGRKLSIVGATLPSGQEVLIIENTQGQISEIKSNKGFIEKIFSIWLGKTTDSGIASLKAAVLK
jgi:hypothetical protein